LTCPPRRRPTQTAKIPNFLKCAQANSISVAQLRATLAQLGCELRAKAKAPPADAVVADHHASLGEKQLNVSKAWAGKVIKPDCMPDDLSRNAVPRVGDGLGRYFAILAQPLRSGQRSFNATMP
jgi:hypothetical protein